MSSKLKVNFIITQESIILNYNGETHNVLRSSEFASDVVAALKNKEFDLIPDLVDKVTAIKKFSNDTINVVNGIVMIDDFEVPEVLSSKIIDFMENDLPYEPLLEFAKNLLDNPSNTALNSLYRFLEHNNHPITEDGHFIAYKRVRSDFMDIHTGTFDNSPGNTPSVKRNQVDENIDNTCSFGLHVANWEYAHLHYSHAPNDILLEVKVNPAHVVAVPRDYNNAKMRVCEYYVVGVVQNAHEEGELLRRNLESTLDDNYDDEDDYEDDCDYCEVCDLDCLDCDCELEEDEEDFDEGFDNR